ncbi:MAG: SAM-dependent methyltransferase [Myxococcota bacterium]
MRDEWAKAFSATAQEWWTEARTKAVLGDKRLAFPPAEAAVLLRALGLMNGDATMPPDRIRKYRQINHMLRVLRPSLEALADTCDRPCIVDAGCGRSYLTMLIAWWFAHTRLQSVQILGIDRSPALVQTCRERAERAGLQASLRFLAAPLADLDLEEAWRAEFGEPWAGLDALVSLHACDTATDDALVLAVEHQARFVAVAPCCQRELSAAWKHRPELGPWAASPHLRRTAAATTTDTYRMLLLQTQGYETSAVEFVEALHTPKNTLIRGLLRPPAKPEARLRYCQFRDRTGGVDIALARRWGVV